MSHCRADTALVQLSVPAVAQCTSAKALGNGRNAQVWVKLFYGPIFLLVCFLCAFLWNRVGNAILLKVKKNSDSGGRKEAKP